MHRNLESPHHLFQPLMFKGSDEQWSPAFTRALGPPAPVTVSTASVLSLVSFNFICGDKTLLDQVVVQPWLSSLDRPGPPALQDIPPHGLRYSEPNRTARELLRLLLIEARTACADVPNIYVLLSGGLDSRVVAGVLRRLIDNGELKVTPVAVTWGRDSSRDVVYGRRAADMLGFDWLHLPVSPETLWDNISYMARHQGAMVPPHHLHAMITLQKQVPPGSLVLSGSYGDSIGRAEFSGRHLMQLTPFRPGNYQRLLNEAVVADAGAELAAEMQKLKTRAPGAFRFSYLEHEQQGHYMRRMLAYTMSAISDNGSHVYQMFTHPSVYSYMWSLHPGCRTDDVYVHLLRLLGYDLLSLPWARTNKSLAGPVSNVQPNAPADFHDYRAWAGGPLHKQVSELIAPDWFAETGLFNPHSVSALTSSVRNKHASAKQVGIWLWLATFRLFVDGMRKQGYSVKLQPPLKSDFFSQPPAAPVFRGTAAALKTIAAQWPPVKAGMQLKKRISKTRAVRRSFKQYPPLQPGDPDPER